MRIILSAAMSLDGYIDDGGDQRLIISGAKDLEAVYDLRDTCDAILGGAETIRRDNPSLMTKNDARRRQRLTRGLTAEPIKVVLSRSGNLPVGAKFFTDGDGEKLVYHSMDKAFADLRARNIKRLLVEGGAAILSQFLQSGLAHELRLAVGPFLVGGRASAALRASGYPAPR